MPTPCWLKHLCSIRALVPMSFFLFLSLSLRLFLWSAKALWVHFPARVSKTLKKALCAFTSSRGYLRPLCKQALNVLRKIKNRTTTWFINFTFVHIPSRNISTILLRSFNGPEPGGLESTKVKERERGWYSLVYAESQLSPCTGLALFTKASGALSKGWRCRAPSWEGLRSLGRKVNTEDLCAPKYSLRERERKKERHRDQGSDGAKVFQSTWCGHIYCSYPQQR